MVKPHDDPAAEVPIGQDITLTGVVAQVTGTGVREPGTDGAALDDAAEMKTAEYKAVASAGPRTDDTRVDDRTASVPALPAMAGEPEPESVVSTPRRRPHTDSGMHVATPPAQAALQMIRPLVAWSPADRLLAAKLHHDIIAPHTEALARDFFDNMAKHPAVRMFVGAGPARARMASMLRAHLDTFAKSPLSDPWVLARIRIGHAHARVGLPIAAYLASIHALEALIEPKFPPHLAARRTEGRKLRELLRRLLVIEAALVTQAHHSAQVDALNDAMRQQARAGFARQYGTQVDPVTLLARPQHLRTQLAAALQRPVRKGRGCALMVLELVGLQEAAWHRGYAYRDGILAETGARLRATLRGADVAGIEPDGRIFALLTQLKTKEVPIVARRIRTAIEESAYAIGGHSYRQELRIGVALPAPQDAASPTNSLIERALADLTMA
ncbi:MAG: diguanylate cyclase [Myxococcales bacterium]|nr:diguanylate cyclase [Myxococcales bacterium]